jgi:hypothetical protein
MLLRRQPLLWSMVATLALAGCRPLTRIDRDGGDRNVRYLRDAKFRRAELLRSLVRTDVDYARLRLDHYATGKEDDDPRTRDWDTLPEWNPPVAPPLEHAVPLAPIAISDQARKGDQRALIELGERAFFLYPAQLAPFSRFPSDDRFARLGIGRNTTRANVVRVQLFGGEEGISFTCASCHTKIAADGSFVPGAPNDLIDFGRLMIEGQAAQTGALVDASDARVARFLAWGKGRVDVTTNEGTEPVRIADLRAVRFVDYLNASGIVAQRDVVSLAVRIETQIVTAHNQVLRPPREIALGIAHYLYSLGDVKSERALGPVETRGESIFRDSCAKCHANAGYAGKLVPVTAVHTDPAIALSHDRGTGMYRTPSLRFVGTRGALLHDASVQNLDALFDPERSSGGHRFASTLNAEDRGSLVAFVRGL